MGVRKKDKEDAARLRYLHTLKASAERWNVKHDLELAQLSLSKTVQAQLRKEHQKKINEKFMEKELHVHDSLDNEIEHALDTDPYFTF